MPKRRQLGIVALTSKVKTPAAILLRTGGVKLLLLKRRLWRRLLRHGRSILGLGLGGRHRRFSYAYYRQFEYEFSPSSTPLFGLSRGVTAGSRTNKQLCGGSRLLYCLLCGGAGATLEDRSYEDQLFRLEDAALSERRDDDDVKEREVEEPEDLWVYSEEEEVDDDDNDGQEEEQEEQESENEDSVDNRAEKFIERFYENIRIQRQESIELWQEMLQRSC